MIDRINGWLARRKLCKLLGLHPSIPDTALEYLVRYAFVDDPRIRKLYQRWQAK